MSDPRESLEAGAAPRELLLTIVVATRGRHSGLGRMLASLRASEPDAERLERIELVLVEDGPPYLPALPEWPGPVLRHRQPERRGLATARNAGIELARAPAIAFLDDDATCAPGWIAAVLDALASPDCSVVGGVVVPADGGRNLFSALRDQVFYREAFGPEYGPSRDPALVPCLYASGGNSAYRRAVFETVGAFDTALPAAIDTDLGARLRRHGLQPFLHRGMVIVHEHPQTARAYLYRGFVAGITKGILWRRRAPCGAFLSGPRTCVRAIRNLLGWNVVRALRVEGHPRFAVWAMLCANDVAQLVGMANGLAVGARRA